jgi:(S)-mandelate dehydrogenase
MSASLSRAFSIDDLASLARRKLPRAIFDFYAGGAEDEQTLRRNREAFSDTVLAPQVLVDVSTVDTRTILQGAPAAMPMAIAPMGAVGFGCRDGDIAIARAAAQAGIPYVLSTTATASIERVASAVGGRLWFQIFPLKQKEAMLRLVERARQAGYEALVVTADVPVGGKRERDLRNDISMPFRFTARNVLDFASRPRWALDMLLRGMPTMENLTDLSQESTDPTGDASSIGSGFDPAFNWDGLSILRERWPGRLLLKGVVRPDDAVRAAKTGCNGVIVSNHGGRQLDGGVATLKALPAIAAAVGDRVEILLDGGVRRGSDIAKALALGADGVLIGRPVLYGVCAAGERGVIRALDILRDEFVRTLQLCGVARVGDIGPSLLWPQGAIE